MNLATNAMQAMPRGGTLRVSLNACGSTRRASRRSARWTPATTWSSGRRLGGRHRARHPGAASSTRSSPPRRSASAPGSDCRWCTASSPSWAGRSTWPRTSGRAALFTVYLPRAGDAAGGRRDAEESPTAARGSPAGAGGGRRGAAGAARHARRSRNWATRPVGFTSSAAALEAFRADPLGFDAVITDERMPGMSGSTLIREVRGIRAGIPTMLMSGYVGGTVC